ncbi:transcriptional regulator, TetR family [Jannaschia faecimaris]|uniref:Transcriptional regulator, TetR family n=1 Tax=Jannaschia faecimaris TaxID=1244108 RepID=A0A1H3S7H2_9RHOB|nr:TetR/AcrR family transcriptional regulator [Jannaschia faecimaris]SDZ34043.1 transcriptional regulator, TetR family [Jannaschia faecimaris]
MKKSEQTRIRLIESASNGFRRAGYAGVGVDSIAKEAGVTSGAFYAHMGSKDGAFRAALCSSLDQVLVTLPKFREEHGDDWPIAFADYYLGTEHRMDTENGCAMAGLSPDVVRAGDDVKQEYAALMRRIALEVAKGIPGDGQQTEKLDKAWAFLSTLIGALTIARAAGSDAVVSRICAAGKSAALAILESRSQ